MLILRRGRGSDSVHSLVLVLRDSEGQGSLACCSPLDRRVGHDLVTEQQSSFYPYRGYTSNARELPGRTDTWGTAAAKIKTKENQERASPNDMTFYLSANE